MKKHISSANRFTAIITILSLLSITLAACGEPTYEAQNYPVYGFANMRGADGEVYKGIGGAYGKELPVEASTFAVRDGILYYAEQIKEDYVVSEERMGSIYAAPLATPNDVTELLDNAYNVGYGQEKLIGDKIFYTTGYDEEYNFIYAWASVNPQAENSAQAEPSAQAGLINSSRINNIFGYDGTCIFYSGFDKKKSVNIVGSYNLTTQKDKTLFTYANPGEIGNIIGISFYDGNIYAVTMTKQPENYDDRTAEYCVEVRDSKKGKVSSTLPFTLTGAANYGFLFDENTLYYSTAETINGICLVPDETGALQATTYATLKDTEYWGIPHFVPGDGYLYYETLADIDLETGNNDYFYRVSLSGGEPELLAAWFIN